MEPKDELGAFLDTSTTTASSRISSILAQDEEIISAEEDMNIRMSNNNSDVPWQYKWKRLTLAQVGNQKRRDQIEDQDPSLENKIPIQTVSARFNREEMGLLRLPNLQSPYEDCCCHGTENIIQEDDGDVDKKPETSETRDYCITNLLQDETLSWEHLQSSSSSSISCIPEDNNSSEKYLRQNINSLSEHGCIVSVTLLVSKSVLENVDMNTSGHQVTIIPADTILIDIVQDSYYKHDHDVIRDKTHSPTTYEEGDKNDSIDGNSHAMDHVHILQRKVLHWPTTLLTSTMHHTPNDSQTVHDSKKNDGVVGVTLIRTRPKDFQDLGDIDVDEIIDLFEQMNLGVGFDVDSETMANTLIQWIGQSKKTSRNSLSEEEGELLLSCICSDGKVHIFSVLDIVNDSSKDYSTTSRNVDLVEKNMDYDAFSSGFETFLFGQNVLSSMRQKILPLSSPKATIPLAVTMIPEQYEHSILEQNHSTESIEKLTSIMTTSWLKLRDLMKRYDDHRPHFDLSSVDSNFEPSTLPNKTSNNNPYLSCAAFGYIAIAGKGQRCIRRYEDCDSTNIRSGTYQAPGGFVTFISTHHLSETRTTFLPFEPFIMSPVRWKDIELLIICGNKVHECIAMRLDTSSTVTFHSESLRSVEPHDLGKKYESHYIRKFILIHISIAAEKESFHLNSMPIGISGESVNPPYIIMCTNDLGKFVLHKVSLDSYISRPSKELPWAQGIITTSDLRRHHVELDLMATDPCNTFDTCKLWSINGQGWTLLGAAEGSKYKLFSILWEGYSKKDQGSFSEEIAIIDRPFNQIQNALLNFKNHGIIENSHVTLSSPEIQVAAGFFRIGIDENQNLQLSIRSNIIHNGNLSEFEEVIEWLCSQQDNNTAARIALSLLGDNEGLNDFYNETMIACDYSEMPKCGILDGISIFKPNNADAHKYNLIKLSNLAVVCLLNCGTVTSQTLENFLGRNCFYDATVACTILLDKTVEIIENLKASDMVHLAQYSYNPMASEGHALWPIKCLLRVAVSKNFMNDALNMLNQRIPDEIRHRAPPDADAYRSSISISKSIISMILASSNVAPSYLMSLIEQDSRRYYWESLDHETRKCLSLLSVQGKHPFLREKDTRDWVMNLLHIATGLLENDFGDDLDNLLPISYLQDLCSAVTCNAGCDTSQTTLFSRPLVNDLTNVDDYYFQIQEMEDDLYEYLSTGGGNSGGIDYDLFIPALLLLKKRKSNWLKSDIIPVQVILNVACDLAGRFAPDEAKFIIDISSILKQCGLVKNPLAAAYLIGGENGLLLKCVHILTIEKGLTIDEAEKCLLNDPNTKSFEDSLAFRSTTLQEGDFRLTDGHKLLLLLIDQHVLRVRSFGEFRDQKCRGRVDPVFAARLCFNTWLYLSKNNPDKSKPTCIEKWLIERLKFEQECKSSSTRLPAAVLVRALLWYEVIPKSGEIPSKLALSLGFSAQFLIKLARLSYGLLESIPNCTSTQQVLKAESNV